MSESDETPVETGPEMNVLRDAGGTILRLEWVKSGLYFAFNGDEIQPAIDSMTAALHGAEVAATEAATTIELFKSNDDDSPSITV